MKFWVVLTVFVMEFAVWSGAAEEVAAGSSLEHNAADRKQDILCLPGCRLDETLAATPASAPAWCSAWSNGATSCERVRGTAVCHAGTVSSADTAALKGVLATPFVRTLDLTNIVDSEIVDLSGNPVFSKSSIIKSWLQNLDPIVQSPLWSCKTTSTSERLEISCEVMFAQIGATNLDNQFYCHRISALSYDESSSAAASNKATYCAPGCLFEKQKSWYYKALSDVSAEYNFSSPQWCRSWTDGCNHCSQVSASWYNLLFGIPPGHRCLALACPSDASSDHKFCDYIGKSNINN
jgi:hypothetical protein